MCTARLRPHALAAAIAFNDQVALQVLTPSVPIPGIRRRNGGLGQSLDTKLWQLLPAPGRSQRSTGSYSGFMPSFNIRFVQS